MPKSTPVTPKPYRLPACCARVLLLSNPPSAYPTKAVTLLPVMASIDVALTGVEIPVLPFSVSGVEGVYFSNPIRPSKQAKSSRLSVTSPSARTSSPAEPDRLRVTDEPVPVLIARFLAAKSTTWSPSLVAWLTSTDRFRTVGRTSPRPTNPMLATRIRLRGHQGEAKVNVA